MSDKEEEEGFEEVTIEAKWSDVVEAVAECVRRGERVVESAESVDDGSGGGLVTIK